MPFATPARLALVLTLSAALAGCDTPAKAAGERGIGPFPPAPTTGTGPFVFTPVVASKDTRKIYLSTSGSDWNDCRSEAKPCKSPRKAIDKLRDGKPDHLLIKRGDVFDEPFSTDWGVSGRSPEEPIVVTTYGDAPERPKFKSGMNDGLRMSLAVPVRHVHFMDLHLVAHTRDPRSPEFKLDDTRYAPTGITLLASKPIEDILIENCEIAFFGTSLISHTMDRNTVLNRIRLRANNFHDAWKILEGPNNQGHSQGLFIAGVDGLLLEQNVIEHNGGLTVYPDDPRGIVPKGVAARAVTGTWFGRQLYSDSENTNVHLIDNIFANGDGAQLRSGGVATGNAFIRTVHGLTGGDDDDMGPHGANGFRFIARDNLFMEGVDLPTGSITPGPRAFALAFTNTAAEGTEIVNNTFIRDRSAPDHKWGYAINLRPTKADKGGPVRQALVAKNVIVDWRGGFQIEGNAGPGGDIRNVVIEDNLVLNSGRDIGRVTRIITPGPGVVWRRNAYEHGRGNGKWFNEDPFLDLSDWSKLSGETGARAAKVRVANRNVKFEEAVAGKGASYEAAWPVLRQRTRWNWKPELETRPLIAKVRADLGVQP